MYELQWEVELAETHLPEEDDDPQCICGVYRSEHSFLAPFCEGFITPQDWETEKRSIYAAVQYADEYDYYGDRDDERGDGDCQDICEDTMGAFTDVDREDCGCYDYSGPDPREDFGYFGDERLFGE